MQYHFHSPEKMNTTKHFWNFKSPKARTERLLMEAITLRKSINLHQLLTKSYREIQDFWRGFLVAVYSCTMRDRPLARWYRLHSRLHSNKRVAPLVSKITWSKEKTRFGFENGCICLNTHLQRTYGWPRGDILSWDYVIIVQLLRLARTSRKGHSRPFKSETSLIFIHRLGSNCERPWNIFFLLEFESSRVLLFRVLESNN